MNQRNIGNISLFLPKWISSLKLNLSTRWERFWTKYLYLSKSFEWPWNQCDALPENRDTPQKTKTLQIKFNAERANVTPLENKMKYFHVPRTTVKLILYAVCIYACSGGRGQMSREMKAQIEEASLVQQWCESTTKDAISPLDRY